MHNIGSFLQILSETHKIELFLVKKLFLRFEFALYYVNKYCVLFIFSTLNRDVEKKNAKFFLFSYIATETVRQSPYQAYKSLQKFSHNFCIWRSLL